MERVYFRSHGVTLSGQLFPAETSASHRAIVIMLTGDGPGGTQSPTWPLLIDPLLKAGIAIFTFDFHSQGYSGGSREGLSLTVACRNLVDACRRLSDLIALDSYRVGLFGSSFGGTVALASHSFIPRCRAIALKSPASLLVESYEMEHGFPDGMNSWRRSGTSEATGLSYDAYLDALQRNVYQEAMRIAVPLLVVHGEADCVVPLRQSQRLCHVLGEAARLVAIPLCDHNYEAPGAKETLRDAVLDFFVEVLLQPGETTIHQD